jgi:SAM-dependent methyltransferase
MKRKGIYCPTIEDLVELSGIETLHPGGMALTQRTGQVAELASGKKILDVSSGRGTQAIYYAQAFDVEVVGIDLSEEMISAAEGNAAAAGVVGRVRFRVGDSQELPFDAGMFDSAINECAVGIPDDSQAVLNEMVRVTKPGGIVAIHESTWKQELASEEKEEFSERYGTTPLEFEEWKRMLETAGLVEIHWEFDQWSKPEMFWKIRKDRDVPSHSRVFTLGERLRTLVRVVSKHGIRGAITALQNERIFYKAVLSGKLGYCLFWGRKPARSG